MQSLVSATKYLFKNVTPLQLAEKNFDIDI